MTAAKPDAAAKKRVLDRKWRLANKAKVRESYRRWAANHPDRVNIKTRKYRDRNPAAYRAHAILANAIETGRVIRPDTCSCGNPKPEGHHSDYSKPLMVSWLCSKCHMELHARLRGSL